MRHPPWYLNRSSMQPQWSAETSPYALYFQRFQRLNYSQSVYSSLLLFREAQLCRIEQNAKRYIRNFSTESNKERDCSNLITWAAWGPRAICIAFRKTLLIRGQSSLLLLPICTHHLQTKRKKTGKKSETALIKSINATCTICPINIHVRAGDRILLG